MKKAVAMKYKAYEDAAPKVIAKGEGHIAQKIIQKAQEYDISIFQNPELTNMLMDVEVNDNIPPELYKAVVEVFVWLHQVQDKAKLSQ
ncbi:MAG: flagellar biosynthesis protein FlhB [Epsilonproteobacteria bacterium]|nr:flagellar biosynthesis protein FlhB [Campylobacterota bacterium]